MAADPPRGAGAPLAPDASAMTARPPQAKSKVKVRRLPVKPPKKRAPDKPAPSRLDRFEAYVRIFGVVAVSVSAAVAVWQFIDQNIAARKERSIAFMELWQDSDARAAYGRLAAHVETAVAQVDPLPANIDEAAVRLAKRGIGARLIAQLDNGLIADAETWRADFDRLVDFYSEVEFCLSARLCHKGLIVDYFGAEVTSFWDYYSDAARLRRETYYPTWADGVDRLVALVDSR